MARAWPIVPAQAKPISQLSLKTISRWASKAAILRFAIIRSMPSHPSASIHGLRYHTMQTGTSRSLYSHNPLNIRQWWNGASSAVNIRKSWINTPPDVMYWSNSKKISNLLPFSQRWENGNFFTAHQPSNTRTSAVMHPHIKWCASAQQLMCSLRYYIFQQFLLYLLETSIICLKDFCYTFQVLLLYLSTTIPISFEDYPYIPQRLLLYLPASASVSAFHLFFQHQFSLIYDF